ncbi:PREDICTED: natural killer cell receptor 2B4 [Galeopterus variegatus]|uniref:Natural killer cell receptor 2B4 n=1 Tax=Galeopterus variegatus TaxID=482537 RepID=A0ABM0S956_GALVR|nr:PREDICTED: natural killer cell receptor 2B4 [Galeopterus variegatus]
MVGLSGEPLWLRPHNTQTKAHSVQWKVRLFSHSEYRVIWTWKNGSHLDNESSTLDSFDNKFNFTIKDLALCIKAAQQQDSGLYCLEVTDISGKVCRTQFQVLIFDPVEKPHLQVQVKVLDTGKCQVALNCSVSKDGNVSYAWYRGSELIQTAGNLTSWEEQIDVDGLHIYTCNVSNPVSWKNDTHNLTQSCLRAYQEFRFWPFLVTFMILITLFLGTLTCFCVWKRKKQQSQASPREFLTIYEDVKDLQTQRNQQQEQNSPGEGSTIYSMIQSQSSASTSRETAMTLYSYIQPSRKSIHKKKNPSPAFKSTVYEEVGKRQPKAQNPARLSRKELESFYVHP